jgi:hypothetical protein
MAGPARDIDRSLNYQQEPPLPALSEEDRAFLQEMLQK